MAALATAGWSKTGKQDVLLGLTYTSKGSSYLAMLYFLSILEQVSSSEVKQLGLEPMSI